MTADAKALSRAPAEDEDTGLPQEFIRIVEAGCRKSGISHKTVVSDVRRRIRREGDAEGLPELIAALVSVTKERGIADAFSGVFTTSQRQNAAHSETQRSELISVVPFGDRGQVEHLADRIDWVKLLQKGENRCPVVDGEVRVHERLRVDNEEYYRVEISGCEKLEQATTFFDTLRRRGMVLDRSRGMDALAGILRYETRGRTREGHAALGVYAKADGTLELCTDPVPLSDEQAEVVESAKVAASYAATAADVSAYFDLMGRFEPEEWAPVSGLGAIAALTLPLRERALLVPHLFAHSTASGVGKTTLATAFGEVLFGRRGVMAEAIGSEFRFASLLDAGLPLVVNEGERIDQTRFGGALKDSAERALFSKRGTKDLGHRNYLARSPLFMTGNRFPFEARAVRVRFLAPWHDPLRQRERHRPEARRQLDEILGRLRPIGFALTRTILERYRSVGDLLGAVTSARMELEGSSPSYNWRDPRRSGAWALVLLGLRAWADLGKRHGIEFPYADLLVAGPFRERVVVPVDRATFESEADPIDRFRNWLAAWRAANVRNSRTLDVRSDSAGRESESVIFEERAKGEGDLFEDGLLEVDGRKVRGTWVSAPMLQTYNHVQSLEFQIGGINDLARQSADAAGISRSVLLDLKSDARNHTYQNGRKRRSAFLAEEGSE